MGRDVTDLLAASTLPSLEGADAVAEQLVLLVHRSVNWDVWGPRRLTYWDALTARVKAATYAGATLNMWWQDVSSRMDVYAMSRPDRHLLASLLADSQQRAVLRTLRNEADVLVLRVRVAIEQARDVANVTVPR